MVIGTLLCHGASYTWNGGGADWSVAANWTPNGVPGSTDTATINTGTATVSASTNVGTLNLGGGTLTGSGTLTVSNVLNWTGGAMSGTGRTLIAAGATLNLANDSGSVVLDQRVLENAGMVVWTGSGNLSCANAVAITNRPGAMWEARNNQAVQHLNGAGSRFDNAGTFRKTAGMGTTAFMTSIACNNYGSMEVQSGTLAFRGGGSASGSFDVASTGRVEWAASPFSFDGGLQLIGAGIYANSTTITVNGAVSVPLLDLTGTLTGSGTLTVSNVLNWTDGIMSGTGRTLIAAGAVLNLANNSGSVVLDQRVLENAGLVVWTGSGNLFCANAVVITNRPGAVWEARNNQAVQHLNGAGSRFDNAGTFRKTAGMGTTTFTTSIVCNNYGTMDVQSGTLVFRGGGSVAGTFHVASVGRVEWAASPFSFDSGLQLIGAGIYANSTTITVNGMVSVPNLDLTGTLTGAGTLTVSNVLNWTDGTMSGLGRTLIAAGAVLNLANNNGNVVLDQRVLENAGLVVWTGSGNLSCANAVVITNRSGALWEARNNQAVQYFNGAGSRFDNAGTFRKTAGTGTTTFTTSMACNNYGTMSILSGFVAANGGYASTANATLEVGIGGTTPGTGFGQLQVSGTVTLNGGLSVELVNGFYPITNAAFTVLTAGTRSGTFANFLYAFNDIELAMSNTINSVFVEVIKVRPNVPFIANQTNSEMVLFSLNVNATDDDLPPQTLTYALMNSPAGASINSSGLITWTPTEAQGPLVTNITVLVTDNGTPNLTTVRTFLIVVTEINLPPVLTLPSNTVVNELVELNLSATATDPDLPANPLRFALVSGPPGMTVSPSGDIAWTPTEAQGSNTYAVVISVTDTSAEAVNAKELSATNTFTIVVNEINLPPVLTLPVDPFVMEETSFTLNNIATDSDLPANELTFELLAAPAGMTINSTNGSISWTPTEEQGPNTFIVTVRVTDFNPTASNAQHLSATNSFKITVNEVNRPPQLPAQTNYTINELTLLTVTNTASDPDLPTNALRYILLSAPSGALISTNGIITWTPSEAQGPSTNIFTTVVNDNGSPNRSAINSFLVVVNEINVAPTVEPIADLTVNPGETITFSIIATDADLPTNVLSFGLVSPPAGATVELLSGLFNWRPGVAQAATTNLVRLSVTDNGIPSLNATQSFHVTVRPLLPAALTAPTFGNGTTILRVTGPTGPDYVLQGSSSLTQWMSLQTNTPNSVPFSFTDTNGAALPYFFYRLLLQP